jgi:hypothetical protein
MLCVLYEQWKIVILLHEFNIAIGFAFLCVKGFMYFAYRCVVIETLSILVSSLYVTLTARLLTPDEDPQNMTNS